MDLKILDAITEDPAETEDAIEESVEDVLTRKSSLASLNRVFSEASVASLKTPEDMFFQFIQQLGPHTKSLVFTLKQILDELPFVERDTPKTTMFSWLRSFEVEVAVTETFRSSLQDAIDLYRSSRKEALETLYASRALSAAFMPQGDRKTTNAFSAQRSKSGFDSPRGTVKANTIFDRPAEEVLADVEEVSACCGHFSFSLLDFAEDVMIYLDVLQDFKLAFEQSSFSWGWLMFWRFFWTKDPPKFKPGVHFGHSHEHGTVHEIPEPIRKADRFADPERAPVEQPWTWKLYRRLRIFRRDDVRFGIKVGIGAVLFSAPAFLFETRPFFTHWRGEWGLVSYMAV